MRKPYFARSPERFCEYFLFVLAWEFCIEKWRGFLVNFFWSPFPTKRSTKTPRKIRLKFGKTPRKIRGKFGAKFVVKFGTKIRKLRGTFVLQLFWPKKTPPCSYPTCFNLSDINSVSSLLGPRQWQVTTVLGKPMSLFCNKDLL